MSIKVTLSEYLVTLHMQNLYWMAAKQRHLHRLQAESMAMMN